MALSRFPLRRGIDPPGLLALVRNAAPFLFEGPPSDIPFVRRLREYNGEELEHGPYFHLCLCAHWATAGTFVPTDVDSAIRQRLWLMEQPLETRLAMADWTIEAAGWDYRGVTAKIARGPSGGIVSTHEGTWFSVAVGAYAALREAAPAKAREVLDAVAFEAAREDALFSEIVAAGEGLEILRASALLAHNFGDLDRVVDMWNLPQSDALRKMFYDSAKPGSLLYGGRLAYAGALNQRFMAPENHRYFALREPRFLRRSADLLLPVGPFLDAWGARVAREKPTDVGECVSAVLYGIHRTPGTVGYARALAGILEAFPGGMEKLSALLPSRDGRVLKAGPLRAQISIERARFEAQWSRLIRQVPPPKPA